MKLLLADSWRWVEPRRTSHLLIYTAAADDTYLRVRAGDLVVCHTDGTILQNCGYVGNARVCCPRTVAVYANHTRKTEIVRVSAVTGIRETIHTLEPAERPWNWTLADDGVLLVLYVYLVHPTPYITSARVITVDTVSSNASTVPFPVHYYIHAMSAERREIVCAANRLFFSAIGVLDWAGNLKAAIPLLPFRAIGAAVAFGPTGTIALASPTIYLWNWREAMLQRLPFRANTLKWIADRLWYVWQNTLYLLDRDGPRAVVNADANTFYDDGARDFPRATRNGDLLLTQVVHHYVPGQRNPRVACFLAPDERVAWRVPIHMHNPMLLEGAAHCFP